MKPTVVCVKTGVKYDALYVHRLAAMVRRHLFVPYDFVCVTDDATDLHCETIVMKNLPRGWWAKLKLFDIVWPGQAVFLDLDTVIVKNIDFLTEYDGPFCILKDFWNPGYNSSVMSIGPGFGHDIWTTFKGISDNVMSQLHSDQEWITHCVPKAALWQEQAPGMIGSYKADHLYQGPGAFRIVCFHGVPKPHELTGGWVGKHWY